MPLLGGDSLEPTAKRVLSKVRFERSYMRYWSQYNGFGEMREIHALQVAPFLLVDNRSQSRCQKVTSGLF